MKNRTVLGIICIVLAVAVTFVISPMVSKVSEKKTEVYRFAADISLGAQIKEKDIEKVKVPGSALPEKVIKTDKEIIGKYVTADVFKGDYLTESKISDTANSSRDVFASLKGDKVAMSITINSFAGGLSGKIQNGDIVSIYVTDKDKKTEVPPMLKYVKVITTTTSDGIDENEVVKNEDGSYDLPKTVTVLVSVDQAKALAGYEQNCEMHLALVYRGDEASANKFLQAQDDYLKKAANNNG